VSLLFKAVVDSAAHTRAIIIVGVNNRIIINNINNERDQTGGIDAFGTLDGVS